MTGKMCDGDINNNTKKYKNVKAYAEGVEYRMTDTALNHPITDNPHTGLDVDMASSWDKGWQGADTGSVEPCVAGFDRTAPI